MNIYLPESPSYYDTKELSFYINEKKLKEANAFLIMQPVNKCILHLEKIFNENVNLSGINIHTITINPDYFYSENIFKTQNNNASDKNNEITDLNIYNSVSDLFWSMKNCLLKEGKCSDEKIDFIFRNMELSRLKDKQKRFDVYCDIMFQYIDGHDSIFNDYQMNLHIKNIYTTMINNLNPDFMQAKTISDNHLLTLNGRAINKISADVYHDKKTSDDYIFFLKTVGLYQRQIDIINLIKIFETYDCDSVMFNMEEYKATSYKKNDDYHLINQNILPGKFFISKDYLYQTLILILKNSDYLSEGKIQNLITNIHIEKEKKSLSQTIDNIENPKNGLFRL